MNDDTILSVREAVAYQDEHYVDGDGHLVTEGTVRCWLKTGALPCTRTERGHLGITVGDLRAAWEPADRKAS